MCTYSLLAGLVLLLGSKRVDFLLHSVCVNYQESLTNVDLEAAHILAVELFLGIICILIDHSCEAKELTEVVPIKLAFGKFADFLKESLKRIL